MRVLLVDDSEPFRNLLAEVAVAAGFEVAGTAASGEEAVRLFEELRPDVVIVDVRLPEMSGYEVADRVRAVSAAARVVVVSAADSTCDGRVVPKRFLTPEGLRSALGISSSSG